MADRTAPKSPSAQGREQRADPLWLVAAFLLAVFAYVCAWFPQFATTVPDFERRLDHIALVAAASALVVLGIGWRWLAPASHLRSLGVVGLVVLALIDAI